MYQRSYWKDHVIDQEGKVIQYGTLLDQAHFNNMERGISDAWLAHGIRLFGGTQQTYNEQSEEQIVTLGMNNYPWPFNNKETAVALRQPRENTHYSVEVSVLEYSGGLPGDVQVKDKAQNGFKLLHSGSAKSVKALVKVRGGLS